ncbi:MAG: glycoside hydrolase family 2 TIM barrel-domain containing protein [Bacteroidales bacterium]
MKNKMFSLLSLFLLISFYSLKAAPEPAFSTAGFFEIPNSGRAAYSMNPAWRFFKGSITEGAEQVAFDDSKWPVIALPDGIEHLPVDASGCINYQGEVWYRKHFTPEKGLKGKKLFLHFEGIMGKSRIYLNGKILKEQFGGYLPVAVDITNDLNWEGDNVIAVWADNSNDPNYPPGKAQEVLDFAYFGGIYRDCWLISHNDVFITDPNFEDEIAGGGLFISFDQVSESSADVVLKSHIRNDGTNKFVGSIEFELQQANGKRVKSVTNRIEIRPGDALYAKNRIVVKSPKLWSPENPELYHIVIRIKNNKGAVVDGYKRRIGIRSIEFKGKDGFWLNGKPYEQPIIGANRHQDFAIIGNAVPNSLHWRDAKKLRDAGMKIIRNAHCPQDPAFMDACDELGLFVIVNTPGWQFWNEKPIFEKRVYEDIRNLVRRDRNHPSVWLWEPILNETWYPADFAKNALEIVSEEYPYPYCYSGCDSEARGHEVYPVQFCHPSNADKDWAIKDINPEVSYFTREWGDNVDDWNSHNSPSRVARNWGEHAMIVQANHYASPNFPYTSYDALHKTTRQHMGGCLWHSFDHQRGYHPDPFYGGIMDAFRQPKYAYHMFMAQREPQKEERPFKTGPMVHIAHEMTPFSPKDVTVFSNCEEVRLSYNKGGESYSYKKNTEHKGIPSPVITFEGIFDFMIDKGLSRSGKQKDVYLLAEGIMNGTVVATDTVRPARRAEKILMWLDNENTSLVADGSDMVTLIAAIADKDGNIKRLNNESILFHIEGEGKIIGDSRISANPAPVKWGTAPVIIRSTLSPGKVKVTATVLFEGSQKPTTSVFEFESIPTNQRLIYNEKEAAYISYVNKTLSTTKGKTEAELETERIQKAKNALKLKEVEIQQADFGEKK